MILQGFRNLAISPQHALPTLGLQFPHHGMAAFRMPGHDQGEAPRLARRFCDQNFLPVMRAGGQHYRLAAFQFVQNGGKLRISLPALRHLLVKFDASRHVDNGGTHAHGFKPPDIPLVLYAHCVKEGKIIL